MKTSMTMAQLASRLDEINAELVSRQDENFRAWSQTQLKPDQADVWERLGADLCQLCALVEAYYQRVDEFWGTDAPRERPMLLGDPGLLEAFAEMVSFRDAFRASGFRRDLAAKAQRKAWKFLVDFPEAHQRFLEQLKTMAENRVLE